MSMSVTGKVIHGQVVLPPGTVLPQGVTVTIETHLPPDYALNHGHYNRGEPKK